MNDFSDWIGWGYTRSEPVSERLIAQFRATLAGYLAEAEVPVGLHWCLVPDVVEPAHLGRDCHPKPGIFLPALPLPRRMWAGGELEFHEPFQVDDVVERETVIEGVTFKQGRSGRLGFVSQRHVYKAGGAPRLTERQDIVYREDPTPGQARPPAPAEEWPGAEAWHLTPDPTLLFRFSALTFNGHRIHYDHPYATQVEGYEGLVVHGPMQAVWMMNLAVQAANRTVRRFSYRGRTPLICSAEVAIESRARDGGMDLRVRHVADGVVTMEGRAALED
ncbi:FAS1-like dehydratase domain-containing protein [Roseovarius ramblicola]|uniref:MaoC family dehydratase N-terminal domain-containing protein n=1 Tax=Roseovarius ramblicola TaxID=2022336 RepID=A0ABV5HZG8_9RHOB